VTVMKKGGKGNKLGGYLAKTGPKKGGKRPC
jgi:hypothetical protein